MPKKEVYITNCIGSITLPIKARDCEEQHNWFAKSMMEETCKEISRLEKSHVRNRTKKNRNVVGHEGICELPTNFKKDSTKHRYVKNSDELIMNSSPLGPDDQ